MFEIIELEQTCGACPSQWEGKLADGRGIYIRYRWGHLSASVGPGKYGVDNFDGWSEVFSAETGRDMDGVMDFDELRWHTGGIIKFRDDMRWITK